MAFQNVAHRNASQGAHHVISAHDGKYYLSFTHANTHLTQSVMTEQACHDQRSTLHSVPGQSLMSTPGEMPQSVSQACYALPKHQKGSTQVGQQPLGNNTSNLGQAEKLMHLLMYKDGQIAALNSKLESLHSSMQTYVAKEKDTMRQTKILHSELEAKEIDRQKLLKDLALFKSTKRSVAIEKGKLERYLEKRTAEFSEMSQKYESLEAEMEVLRKTNVEIWDERRELMQKFEDLEANCKTHSETYKKQIENLTQVRDTVETLENEKKCVEAEKKKLQKSKEEAFHTVQVLKSVIKQKENRIDHLQGKLKEMTKESSKADIVAICDCPDKEEKLAMRHSLKVMEDSEARLGDMLAKMKNQISCLNMEKEKARQQMIQAWESETNLRTALEKEKAERANTEKQLGKMKKSEKLKAKLAQEEAAGNAAKDVKLEALVTQNAKLKNQIAELEAKVDSGTQFPDELAGKQKEERCKKLYKDLMQYHVSPGHCKGVAQCVLKNLLNMSMRLPGKEFAWTAQRPPTPHVSDEEEGEEVEEDVEDINDGDHHESDNIEVLSDDDEVGSSKTITQSTDRKKELTDKLELYGGLWCAPDEMDCHLEKLDEKEGEEAVIVQLQYRSIVLELSRESKLLHSSLTGKQKPFHELKAGLLKLIKQSKHDSVKYFTEGLEGSTRMEAITQQRKRMYSPGPDHPILRPRKKQSSRRTWRKVAFECLYGKVIDHYAYDSDGCRDWHRGIVIEQARSNVTILYEFAKDCPVKLSLKDAKDDFDKGDLVCCEITLKDFVGKVIENLWLMDGGVTEWWKGHVLKMGDSKGEDTEYEVAYSESKDEEFIYFVPLYKDYWCNEVRILSL